MKTIMNRSIMNLKSIVIITFLLSLFVYHRYLTTEKLKHLKQPTMAQKGGKKENSRRPIKTIKTQFDYSSNLNQMSILPCNRGPYVWDKSLHHEGIGSTFDYRKYSFIAQGILKAKWIGNLWNSHEKLFSILKKQGELSLRKTMEDTGKYFGLHYSECNYNSLSLLEKQKGSLHRFFYTKKKQCRGEEIFRSCFDTFKMNKKTVVVFDWEDRRSDYGYATINKVFRYVLLK